MKAGETTLNDLIVRGDRQYQVPLYQRPYTWADENWRQLWADVLDQYDALKHGRSSQSAHFFGSFVLAPFNINARSAPSFLVVDGQQRLTTVFLLLAALRDTAAATKPDEYAHFQGVLENERARRDEDRPRLVPTQSDRPAFQSIIEGHPETAGDTKVAQAYRFFLAQLAKPDDELDPLDPELIQRVVLDRLAVVEITADRDDNPHRIFESLNARGVPLTQADLLRNYIFMLLPKRGERLYRDVWLPMQEALGPDHMVGLARVDLQRRGIEANLGDVYRLQQERLGRFEGDEEALEREVRDLAVQAGYYRCFIDPSVEPDLELRSSLERLRQWGAQTTYPLLMHVYGLRGAGTATTAQLRRCLLYVEAFLVRRQLVGVPTNQLNRLFADAVRQLNAHLDVEEGLRELLSRERRYWPTDDQVRQAVRTRNFYYTGRGPQRMLILERLEESFEHKEPVDIRAAKPTIEHIMPQKLSDEWREHLVAAGDDPTSIHDQLLHTLGNLTLSAYNTELSNSVFERKQQMFSTSHFELNRPLAESPDWTSKEIFARADSLADRIVSIWPGPLASGSGAPDATDWGRADAAIALIPRDRTCTVDELAKLVPTTAGELLARLMARSEQRSLERVIDSDGKPLTSPVSDNSYLPVQAPRPIGAFELAQLMPFEFDGEELKAIRRSQSGSSRRPGSPMSDDKLVSFLRIAEGLNVADLRAIRQRVYGLRGTPQNPTDWSDPDRWISERLEGKDADLARLVWEQSGHQVNPRYLSRRMAAIERLRLATVSDACYALTDRGRGVLAGDLSILSEGTGSESGRSRADINLEFWERFLSRADESGSRFAGLKPQRYDWIGRSAGIRGVSYNVAVRAFHTLVELYIDTQDRETNLQILEALREHQAEIEGALDAPVEWVVKPDVRAMRIAYEAESGGFVDGASLGEVASDLHDNFLRFEAAVQPFIDEMAPDQAVALGWQPRANPWSEAEYLAAIAASCPENEAPAEAVLRWATDDPRVSIEGGWGPQMVGIRLRTARTGEPSSEHSFINLWANNADNASAEVQFASMMRREPFVDRSRRLELLNELSALSTSTWVDDDANMRVPFRLRDLRDPSRLQLFLDIWRRYLDEFHSYEVAASDPELNSDGITAGDDVVAPDAVADARQ